MSEGKQFERDFKQSVLEHQLYLRLNDAGGWNKSDELRFTPSNICDCILFSPRTLYLIELKSHTGKSIPATALKQCEALSKVQIEGVLPAFVCNFRDYCETWLVEAYIVKQELSERKSLSLDTCRKFGMRLKQKRLRVHWRYDLDVL